MTDPNSISQILWSTDPATQRAIGMVLGLALFCAITIYIPLAVRALRLLMLERRVRSLVDYSHGALGAPATRSGARATRDERTFNRDELRSAFSNSPIAQAYAEFERRWTTAELTESIDRAPIRLMDIFDERPLLPVGPRRSLLPVLPGLFLGVGVFAALMGLIPGLSGLPTGELSDARSSWMATQIALALRASAWGFLSAFTASISGRLILGAFDARSHRLDEIVESTFGSVSPGELAEITRQTQQNNLDLLGKQLSQFANEHNERLDRGLQRIEQSTARAANLVSQEQRGALHTVVQELSLSVRQGVEHHLGELRGALQRAIEHQTSVTGGLAETFERMVENSHTQDRVARTLADSASAVEEAAHTMRGSATEMKPILEHLSSTSRGLSETAGHMGDTQKVVSRTADGIRISLEHAASGVDDQRQFIEMSLGEIRHALVGLGDGLGESLQQSLRSVDNVLAGTVGQLRDTLAESNETIERLTGPIRAAEGSTRETHLALDRVKAEVEALGQWMAQAAKPLRSGLSDVESRTEDIGHAMTEFAKQTQKIDKTMESLREEIREESRRLQGTGSELSRRLKFAGDAVGAFDPGSPETNRRGHSPSSAGSRERNWSPSPADRNRDASPSSPKSPPTSPPSPPSPPRAPNRGSSTTPDDSTSAPSNSEHEPETKTRSGGERPQPGFRVGSAPAQGPDPYSRFESSEPQPSNVRHLPTRDRELGDGLKLSGLLGRSGPESDDSADTQGDGNAKSSDSKTEGSSSDESE